MRKATHSVLQEPQPLIQSIVDGDPLCTAHELDTARSE